MIGVFVATTLGLIGIVGKVYPDKKAYPREFENGIERELGGPGAVRVSNSAPVTGPDVSPRANSFSGQERGRRRSLRMKAGRLVSFVPTYSPVPYGHPDQ